MKKKIIWIMLVLILVTGCKKKQDENNETPQSNETSIKLENSNLTIELGSDTTLYSLINDEYKEVIISF